MTPLELAARVAGAALRHRDTGADVVRLGVDAPVTDDGAGFADHVAAVLRDAAVPVARVRTEDFLRARSLRLEYGHDDPDAFYDLWIDVGALRREVLDPLGPGGRRTWLPRLRDPRTDRSARVAAEPAPPGTVAVVDGPFLLRPELRDGFDVVVHLDVTPGARRRRVPADDAARVLPAWERYLAEVDPAALADLVVRFDHPDRPALLRG